MQFSYVNYLINIKFISYGVTLKELSNFINFIYIFTNNSKKMLFCWGIFKFFLNKTLSLMKGTHLTSCDSTKNV